MGAIRASMGSAANVNIAASGVNTEVSAESIAVIAETIAGATAETGVVVIVAVDLTATVAHEGTVLTVATAGVVIVGAVTGAGKPRIRANLSHTVL